MIELDTVKIEPRQLRRIRQRIRGDEPAKQVAKRLGILHQSLSHYETGKSYPSVKVLLRWMLLFGCYDIRALLPRDQQEALGYREEHDADRQQ